MTKVFDFEEPTRLIRARRENKEGKESKRGKPFARELKKTGRGGNKLDLTEDQHLKRNGVGDEGKEGGS